MSHLTGPAPAREPPLDAIPPGTGMPGYWDESVSHIGTGVSE
ncbi:hypothetical protein AB0I82_17915 [Streptomyces sp. NPDC050315]